MKPEKSVIVLASGGLDSTVLLWKLKQEYLVRALSVNYGQRHSPELRAASIICRAAGIEHQIADLSKLSVLFSGSSQTSPDIPVPEGHYTDESMKQTVVPNRNMVLLALAGAWAVSTKSYGVAYAAHGGDHAIYPDCRPDFTEAMGDAFSNCDWHKLKLLRPFVWPTPMSKADIVRLGTELQVPLGLTYSCYKGGELHCGKCGTCRERREAFEVAEVPDPTRYE